MKYGQKHTEDQGQASSLAPMSIDQEDSDTLFISGSPKTQVNPPEHSDSDSENTVELTISIEDAGKKKAAVQQLLRLILTRMMAGKKRRLLHQAA